MLLTLLMFAAVVLWWRRLVGALTNPLEPALLTGCAVSVAAVGAAIRAATRGPAPAWMPREVLRLFGYSPDATAAAGQTAANADWSAFVDRCLPWTVSAAVVAIGVALSLRGTSLSGLVLFWTILAGEELWGWTRGYRPGWAHALAPVALAPSQEPLAPTSVPQRVGHLFPVAEEPDLDVIPAPDVLQQMIRRRAADGGEVLSGWLRVPLAASQRTANVHVAFCPPFPRTPQVTVDQLEGPAARIKKVQVLPYGARLDLKLVELSDAPAAVVLQFSALSGPPAAQPAPEAESPENADREEQTAG